MAAKDVRETDVPAPDQPGVSESIGGSVDTTTSGRTRGMPAWLRLNWVGCVGALFGFAGALTPSLLPRPPLFQGLVAGVGLAIGYGLGTLCSWVIRGVVSRGPSRSVARLAWRGLWVVGIISMVVALVVGGQRQNEVRVLVGEEPINAGPIVFEIGRASCRERV